jgi:hypothetical protein
MTGEQLPYGDDTEMAAMAQMMGGGMPPAPGGMPPMDESMDPNGMTEMPIPNFAVPAVLELIEILESEMMGAGVGDGGMGGGMGGQMPGPMPPMM